MSTPAGWYDDGQGAQRWWDGAQWTEHVQPAVAETAPPPPANATGTDPATPAAASAEPPRRSRLWVLWVVLGVVAVLLVALAAVLVPMLVGLFSPGSASNDAERGAVASVELLDEAWDDADCDAYFAATTEAMRGDYGYTDCAGFVSAAEALDETTDDYEIAITSIETLSDGSVSVTTSETYTTSVDEEGNTLSPPEPREDILTYTVIPRGDGWAIDLIE